MKTPEEKLAALNQALYETIHAEPITEFSNQRMDDTDYEQNYALAQMYAMKGYRVYLENQINKSIKTAAIGNEDFVDMMYNKARIMAFKELLIVAKNAFTTLQKVKSITGKKDAPIV